MKQQTILVLISQQDEVAEEELEQFELNVDDESGRAVVIGKLQKAFRSSFTIPEGQERMTDLHSMKARSDISLAIDQAFAGEGKI